MNDREQYLAETRNSNWNLFDGGEDNSEVVVGNESTFNATDYQDIEERR